MTLFLALLPWILLVLALPLVLRRRPRLVDYPERRGEGAPAVSVIVPARDEALNIGACVATLLSSSYPRFDVVVVDDHSRDGTAEIVRALAERSGKTELRVVEAPELPAGWVGKPWACWQGYGAAAGELLLFTDADTRHDPDLLGRAVQALERESADLLSALPRPSLEGRWARILLPHLRLANELRYPDAAAVNRRTRPANGVQPDGASAVEAVAQGQFLLIRREAYERVGGHEAVRGEVLEDVRLAQILVERGRRTFLVHAEELLDVRVDERLPEILDGWTKHLARSARLAVEPWLRPIVPWLVAALLIGWWVLPPLALLLSTLRRGWLVWSAAATALSLVFWTAIYVRDRIPPRYVLAYPIGGAVAAWVYARSALRGDVARWKGRVLGGRRDEAIPPSRP